MIFSQEKAFWQYRKDNPELRFFEALAKFIDADQILVRKGNGTQNTKYWQDMGMVKYRE